MKTNVANLLIGDLTNRFPIKSGHNIDNEIIGVMVDNWDRKQYLTSHITLSFDNAKGRKDKYMM